MLYHDLWVVYDEDLRPEVLDQGIREKVEADPTIVFPESLGEKNSIDLMRQVLNRSTYSTGKENRKHLDDRLLVL